MSKIVEDKISLAQNYPCQYLNISGVKIYVRVRFNWQMCCQLLQLHVTHIMFGNKPVLCYVICSVSQGFSCNHGNPWGKTTNAQNSSLPFLFSSFPFPFFLPLSLSPSPFLPSVTLSLLFPFPFFPPSPFPLPPFPFLTSSHNPVGSSGERC